MIDTGEPVVGAVGPVVAEEAAAAEFVFRDDEAVGGYAFVPYCVGVLGAGGAAFVNDEVFVFLGEFNGRVVFGDGGDGHAFAFGVGLCEIEGELRGFFLEFEGDAGDAVDDVV